MSHRRIYFILLSLFLIVGASAAHAESGIASQYSYSNKRTASGERLNSDALTAAHRTLPFGTMVRVTSQKSGRSVIVRINDRGPFVRGRVIDLTSVGADQLGFSGLAPVTLTVVSTPDKAAP